MSEEKKRKENDNGVTKKQKKMYIISLRLFYSTMRLLPYFHIF